MKDPGFQPADPRPIEAPRERRARHFPRSGRLFVVAVLMLVAFVGALAFIAGVTGMFIDATKKIDLGDEAMVPNP